MKYFDREFMTGGLTDEECDKRIHMYDNHIQEILSNANYKIKMLAEAISLHDAKILEINEFGKKKRIPHPDRRQSERAYSTTAHIFQFKKSRIETVKTPL